MRKFILLLLIGALLIVSVSAGAEYKEYRLTEGDISDSASWICYPLDADNAVVIARSFSKPWHVSWYRNGKLFRDLTGSSDDFKLIPLPVIGEDQELRLLRSIPKEGVPQDSRLEPDVDCYSTHLARWTENGLEREEDLTYSRAVVCCGGSILIRDREGSLVLQHDGKETVLPANIADGRDSAIMECVPLEEDVYLLEVRRTKEVRDYLICVDHGQEKYRFAIPSEYYTQMPDGRGGFFCPVDWPSGDYTPVTLNHYDPEGRMDRSLKLGGEKVVVQVFGSAANRDTGCCTLYGTAVANSRKVYAAFAMTLDENLNVTGLDVRKIDPAYRDYSPTVYLAPDGTAHVFISDVEHKYGLRPVLMPFSRLEKSSSNYGLALR